MEMPILLHQLGLNDKEIRVYLTLLSGGPASVRRLADDTSLNRGTVYDALKSLQRQGLAVFYQKHKKQFFMAEDPEKLVETLGQRERDLGSLKRQLAEQLPEMRSIYAHGGTKPVVKYYEGTKGANIILKDVLQTMSGESSKLYRAWSSAALRESLYKDFPLFTQERIARRLDVRVIAIGAGGEETPHSERRWLPTRAVAPTYSIIYGPKVAFFSFGPKDDLIGVLIEDLSIADTERLIFDRVWESLGSRQADAQAVAQAAVAADD